MLRLLCVSGLVAVSLTASGAAVAQSLPLGSIIDAIGRGQGAATAPESAARQGGTWVARLRDTRQARPPTTL